MKYKIIEEMDGWAICVRRKLSWFGWLQQWTTKKRVWVEIANASTYRNAKKWIKKHKRINSQKAKYYGLPLW